MDALIFDFDGVIVDSEPIHYAGYEQVLRSRGIELTREDYYARYLGYDDYDCFNAIFNDLRMEVDETAILDLIAQKTMIVQKVFATDTRALPGAAELIRQAELSAIPLAICSGANTREIELASRAIKVRDSFMTIVSADNVEQGKPSPEGYRLALAELSRLTGRVLLADRCVVVEDSPAGIEAAKGAGMRVLAVATSYEPSALTTADRIVGSLADVTLASLESLVQKH